MGVELKMMKFVILLLLLLLAYPPVTLASVLAPIRNLATPSNNNNNNNNTASSSTTTTTNTNNNNDNNTASSSSSFTSLHQHQHQHQQQSLFSSSTTNCVHGRDGLSAVIETSPQHHTFHFLVNVTSHFLYLQMSLKLDACFNYIIYRGHRYLTRDEDSWRQIPEGSQVTVEMDYTRSPDGHHIYHLNIESLGIQKTVNTSLKCGQFAGFSVKANGASMCELRWRENTFAGGVLVDGGRGRRSTWSSSLSPVSSLYNLQRWACGAYVMACCFTIAFYLFFLVARRCRKTNNVQYTIVVQGMCERPHAVSILLDDTKQRNTTNNSTMQHNTMQHNST
ncbi:hypothetical protein Pmani_001008 [Petrolisthes manimaculis]|uniref:Uncharacterized protein n=1 Tax=Petrolisthes manimaculis TaxID=1843537 RepID=A0AAE1QKS0_9EUCA|nr:hypothetical protein Pmani_001008 [Petrolisthes manimaculis]